MTDEEQAEVLTERLAGVPEKQVARRNRVAANTVRKIVSSTRREMGEEEWREAAEVLRTRILGRIDAWLEEALGTLGARDLSRVRTERIPAMMRDVAHLRDSVASPAPGTGETPAQRIAREQQPELKRESVEEWNARHAGYSKPQ